MDDIAAQRQRLTEQMARIDAERLKVTEELGELDAAERVLSRLTATTGRRGRGKGAQNAKPEKQPQSSAARRITPRGERKPAKHEVPFREATEVSPNVGDGLRYQAAAVWDFEDPELAATSIPSVNLTP
jgi:hypothetical protein